MGGGVKFRQVMLCEETYGLYYTPAHEIWLWLEGRIFMSLTRHGDAISFHFSADRGSLRKLQYALHDFTQQVIASFPWCQMLIGCVKLDSVARLARALGFYHVIDHSDVKIYARYI
jgi:hypothetical protein